MFYQKHKAIIWFVIGVLWAMAVMTIVGMAYDYVCADFTGAPVSFPLGELL